MSPKFRMNLKPYGFARFKYVFLHYVFSFREKALNKVVLKMFVFCFEKPWIGCYRSLMPAPALAHAPSRCSSVRATQLASVSACWERRNNMYSGNILKRFYNAILPTGRVLWIGPRNSRELGLYHTIVTVYGLCFISHSHSKRWCFLSTSIHNGVFSFLVSYCWQGMSKFHSSEFLK